MRALSSISVLVSVLLTAAACDSGPGPQGPQESLLIVAPTAATIQGGKTLQLNLTAHDETGKSVIPTKVTWVSSDPRVADVNGTGIVTGRSIGASEITVYWAGLTKYSRITVTDGSGSGTGSCSTGGKPDPSFSSANAGQASPALLKVCIPR
jgi:Big-like domain-containing protein